MSAHTPSGQKQGGFMLLEALISILIFSVGVLGLIALQTFAVNSASDAKYRSDAGLLAENLVGQMWVSNRTTTSLQATFSSTGGGAGYAAWASNVAAALPGAAASAPVVTVTPVITTSTPSSLVTIIIYWKAPHEAPAAAPHQYTMIAQIV